SSTTTNLSQVQTLGQTQTPDNVRDVAAFAGQQLYDCSGSSSSIGKGVFQVGTGMPNFGAQTLSPPLNGSDGASTSRFVLLDLDPTVDGADTLYSAASAAGIGVHKYVKQSNGTWIAKGFSAFAGIEQVIAEPNGDGSVSVFIGSGAEVRLLTDTSPLTG